jgi:hypothetical protein
VSLRGAWEFVTQVANIRRGVIQVGSVFQKTVKDQTDSSAGELGGQGEGRPGMGILVDCNGP